jgi:hypothetical protein
LTEHTRRDDESHARLQRTAKEGSHAPIAAFEGDERAGV